MNPPPPIAASFSPPAYSFTVPAPPAADPPAARPARRRNPALWLIGIGLLANAAVLLTRGQAPDIVLDRAAFAQAGGGGGAAGGAGQMLGARGIYMMPAQLGPTSYGLYLLDVDSGTICVYKTNLDHPSADATFHFRLAAARSFKNDRFVEDFNNDRPTPKEIQQLVEDQRKRSDLKQKDDQPTVDQTPKPDENAPDQPKESIK